VGLDRDLAILDCLGFVLIPALHVHRQHMCSDISVDVLLHDLLTSSSNPASHIYDPRSLWQGLPALGDDVLTLRGGDMAHTRVENNTFILISRGVEVIKVTPRLE